MATASRSLKNPTRTSKASAARSVFSSRARLSRSCSSCSARLRLRRSTLPTTSTRKLSGQFPNFEAVMPRDNTRFAVVRASELAASIQRVAQFADERSGAIRLRLEGNELRISANSTESGESEDTIDTPYSGDPILVGFNSVYILDFLKALGNEGEVRLEFKDSQSAGQMRPEDPDAEYRYRYVLMPMRI